MARALAGGQLVVGIAVGGHGEDRRLGESPTRHDAGAAELVLHLLVQRRGLRRATTGEVLDVREQRRVGLGPLGGQIRHVERRTRARMGAALSDQQRDGGGRVERRVAQQRCAVLQRREQPGESADVGEREDQRGTVALADVEPLGHGEADGVDGRIGVARPLRVGRRARRIAEPAEIGAVAVGCRGQRRRIAGGERSGLDDDGLQPVGVGGDGCGHGAEVEPAVLAGGEEQLRSGLTDAEPDLALAVDGDDRVLDHAEARTRSGEDDGLEPGGQLPGDDVAGADTEVGQTGGHHLGGVAVLGEGHPTTLLVHEHLGVGRGGGPRLDELPEVACGQRHGSPCRSVRRLRSIIPDGSSDPPGRAMVETPLCLHPRTLSATSSPRHMPLAASHVVHGDPRPARRPMSMRGDSVDGQERSSMWALMWVPASSVQPLEVA
jgi:hypothetical protein